MEPTPALDAFVGIDWRVFVGICAAYLALAYFFLGARKVYFEPNPDSATED